MIKNENVNEKSLHKAVAAGFKFGQHYKNKSSEATPVTNSNNTTIISNSTSNQIKEKNIKEDGITVCKIVIDLSKLPKDLLPIEIKKPLPNHVVILLDTSDSMNKEGKLENAQKIIEDTINNLNENDKISIITFDEYATILENCTFIKVQDNNENTIVVKLNSNDDKNNIDVEKILKEKKQQNDEIISKQKKLITESLKTLDAGGSTDLQEPFEKIKELTDFKELFSKGNTNETLISSQGDTNQKKLEKLDSYNVKVVLLTDGKDSYNQDKNPGDLIKELSAGFKYFSVLSFAIGPDADVAETNQYNTDNRMSGRVPNNKDLLKISKDVVKFATSTSVPLQISFTVGDKENKKEFKKDFGQIDAPKPKDGNIDDKALPRNFMLVEMKNSDLLNMIKDEKSLKGSIGITIGNKENNQPNELPNTQVPLAGLANILDKIQFEPEIILTLITEAQMNILNTFNGKNIQEVAEKMFQLYQSLPKVNVLFPIPKVGDEAIKNAKKNQLDFNKKLKNMYDTVSALETGNPAIINDATLLLSGENTSSSNNTTTSMSFDLNTSSFMELINNNKSSNNVINNNNTNNNNKNIINITPNITPNSGVINQLQINNQLDNFSFNQISQQLSQTSILQNQTTINNQQNIITPNALPISLMPVQNLYPNLNSNTLQQQFPQFPQQPIKQNQQQLGYTENNNNLLFSQNNTNLNNANNANNVRIEETINKTPN